MKQVLEERVNKKAKGKPQSAFLVKWQGFGVEHNFWEPESGFKTDGIKKLIREVRKANADRAVVKLTRNNRQVEGRIVIMVTI